MPRLAHIAAIALAAVVFVLTLARGSRIAGGADSSGYLSEAVMLARGRLSIEAPIAAAVPWPNAAFTLSPLGWRPATRPGAVVPIYPPGYPLVMAAARTIGGSAGMFLIVPLLAALSVWLTFLLGRRIDGPLTGTLAALLVATSPPFLFQALQPMSDVPATAWWTLAIVLAARGGSPSALASGGAAALALFTRPNLAPLAAAIGVYLAARHWIRAAPHRRLLPPILFALPVAAAALMMAWLHQHEYGSPFTSGYGPAETLYAWENYRPNMHRYTRWLFGSETRLVLAGLVAPIVLLRRARLAPLDGDRMRLVLLALAFPLIVFASYLFYAPFDNWTYLRFLLPAYPALFVLAIAAIHRAGESLGSRGRTIFVLAAAAVILAAHVRTLRASDALGVARGELRYERVGHYARDHVRGPTIFFGEQFTGAVAYYAERPPLRWDWLEPRWLDEAFADLEKRGYRPMIVLEEWEEKEVRARFAGETLGALDWPARAELAGPSPVRLYDPADRERYLRGERWTPAEIR